MLDALINEHGRRLYGLARRLCRNREDAEDLYQETWLKAYRFLDRYDDSRDFGAWLTGICVNCYRDMRRRQKWLFLFPSFRTNEAKDSVLASVPAEITPDHIDVRTAVNALPEKYRLAVVLHYFLGMDVKKTSEALRIPEGTAKYHLYKAREILRGRLDNNG